MKNNLYKHFFFSSLVILVTVLIFYLLVYVIYMSYIHYNIESWFGKGFSAIGEVIYLLFLGLLLIVMVIILIISFKNLLFKMFRKETYIYLFSDIKEYLINVLKYCYYLIGTLIVGGLIIYGMFSIGVSDETEWIFLTNILVILISTVVNLRYLIFEPEDTPKYLSIVPLVSYVVYILIVIVFYKGTCRYINNQEDTPPVDELLAFVIGIILLIIFAIISYKKSID